MAPHLLFCSNVLRNRLEEIAWLCRASRVHAWERPMDTGIVTRDSLICKPWATTWPS